MQQVFGILMQMKKLVDRFVFVNPYNAKDGNMRALSW